MMRWRTVGGRMRSGQKKWLQASQVNEQVGNHIFLNQQDFRSRKLGDAVSTCRIMVGKDSNLNQSEGNLTNRALAVERNLYLRSELKAEDCCGGWEMGFCNLVLAAGEQWCFCNSYQAAAVAAVNLNSSLLPPSLSVTMFRSNRIMRRSNKVSIQASKAKASSNSTQNTAHLNGRQKEGYIVPSFKHKSWKKYPIHEFLSNPSEIQEILKSEAAQSSQSLDSNTYRLCLQTIKILGYEIIPVFDLRVIPTTKDCTFETISCKFEGSEDAKSNKSYLQAFTRIHITWDIHGSKESKPRLDVEMALDISFKVFALPFSLLPLSVVETPGNLLTQALVENHAREILRQLLLHYDKWVLKQCKVSL